jgi:hypothetical protein
LLQEFLLHQGLHLQPTWLRQALLWLRLLLVQQQTDLPEQPLLLRV